MPRRARLEACLCVTARRQAPGVLHHMTIRGIEGRKVLLNIGDREDFLDRLSNLLPESQTACYAWA
jgi:putative transposase